MFPTSQCGGCGPPPAAQASLAPIPLIRALIRRPGVIVKPWVMCVSVCLYVCVCLYVSCVCVCFYVCISLFLYVSVFVCVFVCLCVFISLMLCVFLCASFRVESVSVYVTVWLGCIRVRLRVFACVHMHMWQHHLEWLSEGDDYLSMFTNHLPTWDTGTQLSSPL